MVEVTKEVKTAISVVMIIVVGALVIGTLLASDVFTSITIVNITQVGEYFGLFLTGVLALLGIIGTFVGLSWLLRIVAPFLGFGSKSTRKKSSNMLGE